MQFRDWYFTEAEEPQAAASFLPPRMIIAALTGPQKVRLARLLGARMGPEALRAELIGALKRKDPALADRLSQLSSHQLRYLGTGLANAVKSLKAKKQPEQPFEYPIPKPVGEPTKEPAPLPGERLRRPDEKNPGQERWETPDEARKREKKYQLEKWSTGDLKSRLRWIMIWEHRRKTAKEAGMGTPVTSVLDYSAAWMMRVGILPPGSNIDSNRLATAIESHPEEDPEYPSHKAFIDRVIGLITDALAGGAQAYSHSDMQKLTSHLLQERIAALQVEEAKALFEKERRAPHHRFTPRDFHSLVNMFDNQDFSTYKVL